MLDATMAVNPSSRHKPADHKMAYLNGLTVSLALFAATLIGSGVAVASQLEKLPSPEQINTVPAGAEGMNAYPVVKTADIWLAPQPGLLR